MLDTPTIDQDDQINMHKPARTFIARAVDAPGGGYNAIFAGPGMLPALVMKYGDPDQPAAAEDPEWFKTKADAEARARKVLFDALNSRPRTNSSTMRYPTMPGPDFAAELREVGLSPGEIAHLWGTNQDRVQTDWIDEASNTRVPFPMWWVLELFKDKANLEKVKAIVAQRATVKGPGGG
jgi:hypothetical protein